MLLFLLSAINKILYIYESTDFKLCFIRMRGKILYFLDFLLSILMTMSRAHIRLSFVPIISIEIDTRSNGKCNSDRTLVELLDLSFLSI